MREIDNHLLPADGVPHKLSVYALCAMGGMGKTQIAAQYMFSRADRFDVIMWLYSDNKTILAQTMARVAIDLGLEEEGSQQNISLSCGRVLKWLEQPKQCLDLDFNDKNFAKWLIVFDNVDDLKVLDKNYWPEKGIGSILITSRDPLAKHHFNGPHVVTDGCDVVEFSALEAANLMQELTKANPLHNTVHNGRDSLGDVTELLGGLPLAIAQMAGIIADLRLSSYDEFIKLYKEAGAKTLYRYQDKENRLGKLGYNRMLSTVWALGLLKKEPLSLFRVISLLDPDRIPEFILTTGAADVTLPDYPSQTLQYFTARSSLIESSLIRVNDNEKGLTVHRVVQDQTRAEMDDDTLRETFHAALKLIAKVWPYQTLRKRHDLARKETCEKLYPCAIQSKKVFEDLEKTAKFQPDDEFAALLNDLGW